MDQLILTLLVIVDKTGDVDIENKITERLRKNKLTDNGTETLRITGKGSGVSNLD